MKNEASDLFKISLEEQVAKELENVSKEGGKPEPEGSNPAIDFVDEKIIENQPVPDFGHGMTYGKLFKLYEEGESLPNGIDNVVKFRKWYLESKNNNPDGPTRKAA